MPYTNSHINVNYTRGMWLSETCFSGQIVFSTSLFTCTCLIISSDCVHVTDSPSNFLSPGMYG